MTEWTPFIAHAGLTIGLFAWLRNDINILRRETSARFDALYQEMNTRFDLARKETGERFAELHNDMQAVDVRLARVEATLETTFRLQGVLQPDRNDRVA